MIATEHYNIPGATECLQFSTSPVDPIVNQAVISWLLRLSLPECPRHMNGGQTTKQQSWSLTSGWGYHYSKCSSGYHCAPNGGCYGFLIIPFQVPGPAVVTHMCVEVPQQDNRGTVTRSLVASLKKSENKGSWSDGGWGGSLMPDSYWEHSHRVECMVAELKYTNVCV